MSEKEPIREPIQMERKAGERVIFGVPEKEKPKVLIPKDRYIRQLCEQISYCRAKIMEYSARVLELQGTMHRIDELESLGMRINFYDEGENLSYEAKEKDPLGFNPQSTKDASTWQNEAKKRQAKREQK